MRFAVGGVVAVSLFMTTGAHAGPGRPRGMYIPIPHNQSLPRPTPHIAGGPPVPIFLNRNGGTYHAGPNDSGANSTSILNSGSANMPAFSFSDAVWSQVLSCVTSEYARFNVEVTDQEPSRAHVEAVVSGTPDLLGLPQGVGGVAPIDSYGCSVVDAAVVFIFSDVIGPDAEIICEVAAQEIAHSFSLDHEFLCNDPMTYLSGCGNKTFQDIDAQCGEYQSRACICGRSTQNSVRIMLEKLGASTTGTSSSSGGPTDTVPPTATVTAPANNATLPANSVITVSATASDDVGVATAELIWAFTGNIFPCPYNSTSVSCTATGNTYTWQIHVGTGTRSFQVRARDAAGNEGLSANVSITLTDGGNPGTADTTPPTVNVVSPANGATLQASSLINITATAQDNVQVSSVQLVWDHNNTTFACPTGRSDVTCTSSGNSYTWGLNVGTGSRTFHVTAQDAAGNMSNTSTITINLSDSPPPMDATPPTVMLVSPSDGAMIPSGTAVQVQVTASDNVGITGAELWWGDGMDRYPCPYTAQGVTCAVSGNQYAWQVTAPSGSYPLEVHVQDGAGNTAQTNRISVTVGGGASSSSGGSASSSSSSGGTPTGDDSSEPNNDVNSATRMFCGQSASYIAADTDYYIVTVRDGDSVTATASSTGVTVEWLLRNGNTVGQSSTQGGNIVATAANVPAGDMLVRINPTGTPVNYGLSLDCQPAASGGAPHPFGCADSSTGTSAPFTGLVLAAACFAGLCRRKRTTRT